MKTSDRQYDNLCRDTCWWCWCDEWIVILHDICMHTTTFYATSTCDDPIHHFVMVESTCKKDILIPTITFSSFKTMKVSEIPYHNLWHLYLWYKWYNIMTIPTDTHFVRKYIVSPSFVFMRAQGIAKLSLCPHNMPKMFCNIHHTFGNILHVTLSEKQLQF